MKNLQLTKWLCCIVMVMLCNLSNAQVNNTKQTAFHLQPSSIVIPEQVLNTIINAQEGTTISVAINNTFQLTGNVQYAKQVYNNLKTVIVKLTNYPGILLSISKMSDIYTPEKFVGRLIGSAYSDAYELVLQNGVYNLEKKVTEHLVPTCH